MYCMCPPFLVAAAVPSPRSYDERARPESTAANCAILRWMEEVAELGVWEAAGRMADALERGALEGLRALCDPGFWGARARPSSRVWRRAPAPSPRSAPFPAAACWT